MRPTLSRVRRPEYTGDRRCWPCTVVNSALLALVCGVLAFARWRITALCVGIVGIAAILLRGYVVPYTPRVASQLVNWLPGDPFHTEGSAESGSLAGETTGDEVVQTLVTADVLVEDSEWFRVDEGFRDRWRAEMKTLRIVEPDTLATAAAEHAPTAVSASIVESTGVFDDDDDLWIALEDGSESIMQETWLSIPVAIAEVAAVRALGADIPLKRRATAARPLRMFLEECPACGGPVEESTDACCGGYGSTGPADILVCAECDERLFTFPQDV